ncbi:hypothetical protein ACGC1H_003777 [Rhizoctonia solani]
MTEDGGFTTLQTQFGLLYHEPPRMVSSMARPSIRSSCSHRSYKSNLDNCNEQAPRVYVMHQILDNCIYLSTTMIIDISDDEIAKAYQSIIKDGSKDWLIIGYSKARNALRLVDSGAGGLDIVRNHMKAHSSDVTFSLVQANGPGSLTLICFIPQVVGGVKRARAIVHCRAVEDAFPARRAVVNIASETELTPALLEHALRSHASLTRGLNSEPRLPVGGLQRPMSPPRSSEEGRSGYSAMARVPSSSSSMSKERGLPLNLAEPISSERQQELAHQNTNPGETLAPTSGGIAPERRGPNTRNSKPQLSVSVPPRKEQGLRPITYDGTGGGTYEFDASDDDEDDNNQNSDQDEGQGDTGEGEESVVVRLNSRPASRGATPPPGPSILRHPCPISTKSELGSMSTLGLSTHIRFTGPPKDHPHPNHHPLKPTDVIVIDKPSLGRPQTDGSLNTDNEMNMGPSATISGLPASSSTVFQQSAITSPRPLGNTLSIQDHPIQGDNTSRTSTPSDQSKPPQATAVAPSLLPSSITCPPTSQPGPPVPPSNSINYPPPPENTQASQMPPPRLSSVLESFGPSFERALPPLPPISVSAIPSASLPGSPSLGAHSRNGSVPTTGQTHVPSGTLCAFGRRPSVSNTPQGANGSVTPSSASRLQLEHMSPSALMERSSTTNTATTSSSTPSLRSFTVQTQGMTEAQAQAARSRAKWAAEEQGLTLQSTSTPPLPRSPPLTPPISPPRSLNADEAGRVRRDGVERMRREAERRREEDEKRRLAEQQRRAEVEQQLKLDEERKVRDIKNRAAQEERRRAADLQRKVMEEELGKRRVEERTRAREKFAEVKGTDEVFLTGYVNIQVQNSTVSEIKFFGRLNVC